MSLNSLIISTLDPTNVPVSFQKYTGTATTYITFFEYNQQGALFADDTEQRTQCSVQVDIWSTGNYGALVDQVRSLLTNAEFTRNSEGELYEDGTKVFHRWMRFYFSN
jgi:hypothetical protein